MNSKDVKVTMASPWQPGDKGTLPHRIVLWQKPDDSLAVKHLHRECYVTHLEVNQPGTGLSFAHGNYDLSYNEGMLDFTRRCRQYGIGKEKG